MAINNPNASVVSDEEKSYLSRVKVGGQTYHLKDAEVRETFDTFEYTDTASGKFTPAGTVADIAYTPAGTISGGTVTPTGTVSGSLVQDENGTAVSGTISAPTITVTPTTNSFALQGMVATYDNTADAGNLILSFASTSNAVTGVSAQLASAPTFTGDKFAVSGSFTGTASSVTGATFTGTAATLKTTFTGTEGDVTVTPDTAE